MSTRLLRSVISLDNVTAAAHLAPYIDHTLLKADATQRDIIKLCAEAKEHRFATVCVNSFHLETAVNELRGAETVAIAVIGFPLGACLTEAKAFEARAAVEAGAQEIDMVVNLGALKLGDLQAVERDISAVVRASAPALVKVILETASLRDEEKIAACRAAMNAGAAFVKTSTGFASGGATVDDVKLMRATVGDQLGVKASGGIRTLHDAMNMLRAGANRIGTSNSVAIVTGQLAKNDY
jgi:deoxyribose-phosphate aldolase